MAAVWKRAANVLCVLLVYAVLAPADAAADDDLSETWLDLWTQCRVAIETGQALDVDGLSPMELPPISQGKHNLNNPNYTFRAWRHNEDRFVIVENEWRRQDTVRRGCSVELAPDAPPLNSFEQILLVRTFLIERGQLIVDRAHEVRDPDPLFWVNLGVGPIEHNANGCSVISYLMIATEFFASGTAEQVLIRCGGAISP